MENELYQRWEEILEHMKVSFDITDVSYRTFIKILSIYSVEGNTLTILIDDINIGNSKSFIEKKYNRFLSVAIEEITGIHYDICYLSLTALDAQNNNQVNEKDLKKVRLNPSINPNYTFDTFIVGDNNDYAHAASLKVAEEPGDTYNPLFIYGGPGLGKTHLMHAIANYILENDKSKKVIYVTSETFTNEIVDAVRDSKNEHSTARQEFRNKYRNVDVLLIDDIQFIIGKESTQLEFFHTFNHLYESQKQIIISSDKHPSTMTMLEERLRSRFEMGLTVDVKPPTYETRMAILRKKLSEENIILDDNILDYIASNIVSNIRELQGAINKVISFSNLCDKEITMELAKEALADMINPNMKREITVEYIAETVADHFGITVKDLLSSKRNSNIVFPRHICMYLCRELTGNALAEIGSKLGNRHHSTILHSIELIEKKLKNGDNNEELKKTIDVLNKKINPQ
ncbi:MAG: chromosomal replication initiator protein DnaA [Lachnospiraceae bacterium]|nr:chromosomal replication initiator protein DnaA [Lachnospiraceae bacterium]